MQAGPRPSTGATRRERSEPGATRELKTCFSVYILPSACIHYAANTHKSRCAITGELWQKPWQHAGQQASDHLYSGSASETIFNLSLQSLDGRDAKEPHVRMSERHGRDFPRTAALLLPPPAPTKTLQALIGPPHYRLVNTHLLSSRKRLCLVALRRYPTTLETPPSARWPRQP